MNKLLDKFIIDKYLGSYNVKKLQIGCGKNILSGFINSDFQKMTDEYKLNNLKNDRYVIHMDARNEFPFDDNIFDFVFSEHMLEHLKFNDGISFLKRIYKILKKGGTLRLSIPTFEFVLKLYNNSDNDIVQKYVKWHVSKFDNSLSCFFGNDVPTMMIINNFFRFYGHQTIYDYKTIKQVLDTLNFKDIQEVDMSEDIEQHWKIIPREFNELETTCIQCIK